MPWRFWLVYFLNFGGAWLAASLMVGAAAERDLVLLFLLAIAGAGNMTVVQRLDKLARRRKP